MIPLTDFTPQQLDLMAKAVLSASSKNDNPEEKQMLIDIYVQVWNAQSIVTAREKVLNG